MRPREQEIIGRLIAGYSLNYRHVLAPQHGYRNRSYPVMLADGTTANLILYKSDPDILERIKRADAVSNFLSDRDWPTRRTLDPRIAVLRTPAGRLKYAALYNYLPGETIPWEAYTRRHLKLLGATLGNLHAELAGQTFRPQLPEVTTEYLAIVHRMQSYFAQVPVTTALELKLGLGPPRHLARLESILAVCTNLPHRQPLHLDFVRSNILFTGPNDALKISGILDFEKTAFGHPVFDIARTLAFLLADSKFKSEYHIRKYFLKSGYQKHGGAAFRTPWLQTGSRRLNLLEELINLFLLHDFYKFLRHNPYESLGQNEHFARTRTLLEQRQLLRPLRQNRYY